MHPIRQSFSWWAFANRGANARELIDAAARIGYAGVEMPPREIWDEIRDAGLTIATMTGHNSLSDGMNREANHERIVAEIEENVRLATEWAIPNLIVFSGNRGSIADDVGADACAEVLRRVVAIAQDAGVTLVMELLNSRRDHPDYQADRTAWGAAVCRAVGSDRVKLLYDIYHMQIMEGDVIATIRENAGAIGHYHTAGVPGRHDLDDEQELNYPAVIRAIVATGFAGWIGHEFTPKGPAIPALEAAFRLCADSVNRQ